jgi:hypothetical protein
MDGKEPALSRVEEVIADRPLAIALAIVGCTGRGFDAGGEGGAFTLQ